MFANLNQVTAIYDRLVSAYGLNEGAAIHKALVAGEITPEIRRKVRAIASTITTQVTLH
ncbi:MAG: hypothetical protein AzoDbin1_01895 [Azoarcus sp.]|nr:hypothetical protein [Azoarcus sp.]